MRSLALAGTLAAFGGTAARAQERPPQPRIPPMLPGEWRGTLVLDNSSPEITLQFAAKDSSFAGVVLLDGDRMGDMERCAVKADTVRFSVDRYRFTGVLTHGEMRMSIVMFNGTTRKTTFRKVAGPPDRGLGTRDWGLGRP